MKVLMNKIEEIDGVLLCTENSSDQVSIYLNQDLGMTANKKNNIIGKISKKIFNGEVEFDSHDDFVINWKTA